MWPYHEITREEFEIIKDHIEEIMIAHGAEVFEVDLPYEQGTTTIIIGKEPIEWTGHRRVFKYRDLYYWIDEVCYPQKPFIVAEIGTYDELMKNTMDESEPFPYDLTEQEMEDEVSYFLGEKPYPET